MDTFIKAGLIIVAGIALGIGFALLLAYPTLWVVNYLITPGILIKIFGIPALTFWKAFWLNFLCGSLFKSTSTSSSK